MKKVLTVLAVLAFAMPALAAPGESWILPIHHRDGDFTVVTGAGYEGTDAYQGSGKDGVRRVYWELSGTGSMGNAPPATTELYTIEVYTPTSWPGRMDWQPIESQIRGVDGEQWPIDTLIPWAGAWSTNHQYLGSDAGAPGSWKQAGPGPQGPASDDFDAPGNGIYMWLGGHTGPSWLYAKWNFGYDIERTWSAIRVTQITPEPASLLLLLAGGGMLLRRKSRA